ncbi:MAG: hypothetical protein ACREMA_02390 [Longimicrobiales bacterium]
MIRTSHILAAALVLALPACNRAADDNMDNPDAVPPTTEPLPPATPPTPVTPTPLMTADMKGEGNSAIAGQVQILPVDGDPTGFRVSVNLTNVPEGEHAWHIHQGACSAKDAPVVVPFTAAKDKPGIASPLVAAAGGTVTAEATVPGSLLTTQQLQSADYSLHVHQKAGTDHGPSIACAAL